MNSCFSRYLLIALFLTSTSIFSQTFTMGKKCRTSLDIAQKALADKAYEDALNYYDAFSSKCKTKDAKEIAGYQKAEVLNNLGRYNEAIIEADKALKISKNKSINAYFQKAIALDKLGKSNEAKEALQQVITLTEKNENVKERASNYALMAAFYDRRMDDTTMAQENLTKAKELDPSNIKYVIQEGDMYVSRGNYDKGFECYDEALKINKNSKELYMARSDARFNMLSKKYGTSKAQELRQKITSTEKTLLCADLSKAIELGYKDLNKEMLKALICK